MTSTSNFREAFREAKTHGIVGPNVIANALPYVGGGLLLTALGTYGGLRVIPIQSYSFQQFWVR
jgi:hypothetical protein